MRYTARDIARRLGLPSPTDEQAMVIEAPLTPALVIAGAGSGKTETMANRIVWLLANGLVRVPEILGLTFTRKAAGELSTRVRDRIAQLQADDAEIGADADVLEAPTISTYNAFASSIFREHARLIGREPDVTVITAASAWALAREIVVRSGDERLIETEKSIDRLTTAVVGVAHALSDNDVTGDVDAVRAFCAEFSSLAELEINDGTSRKRVADKDLVAAVADVSRLPVLLDLAELFSREKRARGFVEFSDQIALALEICRGIPRVPGEYRDRYRVVILDEYQDTSVVQTDLLSTLFAGHGVMAVGDPNQSIYGWRGASASNLARFSDDFCGGQERANAYSLSTSWRNAGRILDAANALVEPLPRLEGAPVGRLRPSPHAGDGSVGIRYPETIAEEAEETAAWLQAELARPSAKGQRSAALLCRSLKTVRPFVEALERRGVPYHVLGLAGLLEQPVIVDLVSALTVLGDPTAGSHLIRLLMGAGVRIGPRDIAGLRETARWLERRDVHQQVLDDEVRNALRDSVADGDGASIVDALDFVVTAPDGHRALAGISEEGIRRMRAFGRTLAELRRRSGLDLTDLVNLVVQELRLDIEVAANAGNALGAASLEAFGDMIASFLAVDERGSLRPFLSWLAEVERQENQSPRSDDPEPGTVQILTIHGAKGLEWDSVAVPRLVDGEMPGAPRTKRGWTAFGELPYDFRGDRLDLPVLAWRGAANQQDFARAYAEFTDGIETRHAEEQRRLAYVAVTRARDALLATGSFWATQTRPRMPGSFLREIARSQSAEAEASLPEASALEGNPLADERSMVDWPLDPLGPRAAAVRRAADAVRTADPDAATPWDADIELLLAERARRLAPAGAVDLPLRVPASKFKDYVTDPAAVAVRARRPLPERPYRQTRLGTLFHSWVEQRSGRSGTAETLDTAVAEQDADDDATGTLLPADADELAAFRRLQETFEASEWGGRRPIEVECEIDVVLAGQVIICKLDAVYRDDERYQIVDWKTGRAPRTAEELEQRQLQLALYRHAYGAARGIPAERIDAVLYYVADDLVIRPEHLPTGDELRQLWESRVASGF